MNDHLQQVSFYMACMICVKIDSRFDHGRSFVSHRGCSTPTVTFTPTETSLAASLVVSGFRPALARPTLADSVSAF